MSMKKCDLQNDRVDDVGVLDGEVEGHAPGGGDGVAPDLAPGNAPELVPVVDGDHRHQRGDAGAERVAGEHELVVGAELGEKTSERVGLSVQEPRGGVEEAVVDEAAVEHLLAEVVVEENLVVGLSDEVEAADSEDHLPVLAIGVDQVRRAPAVGDLVVGDALDDAGGVDAEAGVSHVAVGR